MKMLHSGYAVLGLLLTSQLMLDSASSRVDASVLEDNWSPAAGAVQPPEEHSSVVDPLGNAIGTTDNHPLRHIYEMLYVEPPAGHSINELSRARRSAQNNNNGFRTQHPFTSSKRRGQRTTPVTSAEPELTTTYIVQTTTMSQVMGGSLTVHQTGGPTRAQTPEEISRVGAVASSNPEKSENFLSSWMWTAHFVTENTEKLVLYSLLSVALGAVCILLVVVTLLQYRHHCVRTHPADGTNSGSGEVINATESGNVYTPSPATDAQPPALGRTPAWWTARDENDEDIKSTPSASTATNRRLPTVPGASSPNGWSPSADVVLPPAETPPPGMSVLAMAGIVRNGRAMHDDVDNGLPTSHDAVRPLPGYGAIRPDTDGESWSAVGVSGDHDDGTVGTLGRSYNNPYRHDSYRMDGMRTMQFQ